MVVIKEVEVIHSVICNRHIVTLIDVSNQAQ